jgi:type I restriction enzyme, S subunit
MEVRPECKQTEVGVIPEEWEVGGLGRFWSVTDCKHVTAKFVSQGFPIASIREVQSRFVDLTNAKQTTPHFYNLLIEGGRKPRPGDLILSRNATVGEVAQVAEWHQLFAMGQDVCLLRKKSDDLSTEFLQAVFQSSVIASQLANLMVGSTFKRANVEQIRNFSVPMPPASEQRAIATALSDVDALLGGLDRLVAKKRDLKQAAIQQLLTGKTRLPDFSGGWEVKRLGELGAFLKGSGVKKDEAQSGNLPCVRYGEIYTHHSDYIKSFNSWISPQVAAKATRLKQGDLLFAGSGETKEEIGKCVAFVDDCEAYAGGDTVILRAPGVSPIFMGYYCNTAPIAAQKASKGQGDAVVHISAGALSSIVVTLPSLSEQFGIAAVLSDVDAELSALEARHYKTRGLKQAMMQELLTGRTRLV